MGITDRSGSQAEYSSEPDHGSMGLNISTDMSIITSTIARATMGGCLRAESVRWNTMNNFAEKPCMTLMDMKHRGAIDNS